MCVCVYKGKVKVSPLQVMKGHGRVDVMAHIYIATALGGGRMASPTLGRLYSRENPRYSFYRRLSGPQDQSGHEGVQTNLHPSDTKDRTHTLTHSHTTHTHTHTHTHTYIYIYIYIYINIYNTFKLVHLQRKL